MTLRQNNWTLGAYCAMLTQHHGIEDRAVFPHLPRAEALESHPSYEERQITEPLTGLGFYPGQL